MTRNPPPPDNYACSVCGLHYRQEELAKKCADWCRAHHSCNLDIIKHSIENKPTGEQSNQVA